MKIKSLVFQAICITTGAFALIGSSFAAVCPTGYAMMSDGSCRWASLGPSPGHARPIQPPAAPQPAPYSAAPQPQNGASLQAQWQAQQQANAQTQVQANAIQQQCNAMNSAAMNGAVGMTHYYACAPGPNGPGGCFSAGQLCNGGFIQ